MTPLLSARAGSGWFGAFVASCAETGRLEGEEVEFSLLALAVCRRLDRKGQAVFVAAIGADEEFNRWSVARDSTLRQPKRLAHESGKVNLSEIREYFGISAREASRIFGAIRDAVADALR